MQLIAHRGRVGAWPENAIVSLAPALAATDGVEVDVRLSADSVPVLMHDPDVERTTNGSGGVHELTAAQLARLDAGSGHGVPRLDDYLDVAVQARRPVVVDLKDPTPACLRVVVETCAPHLDRADLVLGVRSDVALRQLRALAPSARLASLGITVDNVDDRVRAAADSHAEVLFIHHGDAAYLRNRTAVETIRRHGLTPAASTLTDQQTIDLAADDGCALALVDLPATVSPQEPV